MQILPTCFILCWIALQAAAQDNYIPSGGLESPTYDARGAPKLPGWRLQGEGAAIDMTVAHSGKYAARISVPDLSKVETEWQLWQTSPVLPTLQGKFRLSAWLKTQNVTQGREAQWHNCQGYLTIQNAQGEQIEVITLFSETGQSEWHRIEKTFRMPASAAKMLFTFILRRCEGTAWLDDILLERLDVGTQDEADELRRLNIATSVARERERVLGWSSQGNAAWARGVAHSGQRSLHIRIEKWNPADRWHLWRSDHIARANGKLTFGAWARVANVVPGKTPQHRARCYLAFYDALGKGAGSEQLFAINGTSEWQEYNLALTTPADAKTMEIIALLYGCSGEMWVDDFTLLDERGRNLVLNSSVEKSIDRVRLVVENVPLSKAFEPTDEAFPASATNVRISGDGNFTRNGRPVFLIGAVQSGMGYSWLCKMLGVDFCVINSTGSPGATAQFRLQGDVMHISFKDHDYIEAEIRELLLSGLLPYVSLHEAGWRDDPLRDLRPGLMATGGHYFSYSDCTPDGRNLREQMRKSILKSTRRYPIFLYELFNEVHYMSNAQPNVERFCKTMAEKYRSISSANRAWNTRYHSFNEVNPPYQPDARYKSSWRRGWSESLWFDWVKFNEDRFAEICLGQRELVKTYDPKPNTFITVQSYFSGELDAMGAHPRKKVAAEDVYGHEMYMTITPQLEDAENWAEVMDALRFCTSADIVAEAAPLKPIINEEAGVVPGRKLPSPSLQLFNGAGEWRFKEDNSDKGDASGYWRPKFDDSHWGTIRVPGLWGTQGRRNCSTGWYRRRFNVPEYSGNIWLNGNELTDDATLWLNGHRVYRTKRWNDLFSVKVTRFIKPEQQNTLAIKIVNKYFEGGMYYGGIRRYINLSKTSSDPAPLTPGQMRIYLWESVIHGMSGTVFFNLFAHEGSGRELDPLRFERGAIRAIPAIKNEINALANVALPRPRSKAKVALYYSYASSRGHVPEDATEWLRGYVTPTLVRYYAALTFAGVPFDVIDSYTVLNGGLSPYRAIVVAAAPRVPAGVIEELTRWVQAGGKLLIGPGCFLTNDDDHLPLQATKLVSAPEVTKLETEMPLETLTQCVADFAAGISSDGLRVGSEHTEFLPVEAHVLGRDRRLWYLCYWGARARSVQVQPTETDYPHEGKWRISVSPTPGAQFLPVFETPATATQVHKGIRLTLKSQEPMLVLVEPWDDQPVQLPRLLQSECLNKIWRSSPKASKKILISCLGQYVTRDKIPSAQLLLEANELQVDGARGSLSKTVEIVGMRHEIAKLSDYNVLCILSGTTRPYSVQGCDSVRRFVEQGGGLFVAGNFYRNAHGHFTNSRLNLILAPFGIKLNDDSILSPRANTQGFERFPIFTNFAPHAISRGVKRWVSHGSASLSINTKAEVIARSPSESRRLIGRYTHASGANLPILAARKFGKGRVVVIGDGGWLLPDWLNRGDNALLFWNIINWLTGQDQWPEPKGKEIVALLNLCLSK